MLGLVAAAMAMAGLRSGGAEADDGKDDEDCRLHIVYRTRNSVVLNVE